MPFPAAPSVAASLMSVPSRTWAIKAEVHEPRDGLRPGCGLKLRLQVSVAMTVLVTRFIPDRTQGLWRWSGFLGVTGAVTLLDF